MSRHVPVRAIVGRFTHEVQHAVIEEVLQEHPFEFVCNISTGRIAKHFDAVPKDRQQWFNSGEVRNCHYEGVDWTDLAPLDEELIEQMRHCEAVFMDLVSRLEWKRSIPYTVRKDWYYRHLRFWSDFIVRHRINLYIAAWIPHEIPDVVIYHLCKLWGIPTRHFEDVSITNDTSFFVCDMEESSVAIKSRYEQLLAEYDDVDDPDRVPLSEHYAQRYDALIQPKGELPPESVLHWSTYWGSVLHGVWRKPVAFLCYALGYCTPCGIRRAASAWRRWRSIRTCTAFYDAHTTEPDLNRPFVYLPLHFQPEASTVPLGGAYGCQLLIAQLLGACLPDDVFIYVKEHPHGSSWLMRSVDYYRDLLAIPNVRLIARNIDTFTLREHCRAVATVTGTAGIEALFRGKPVLLFGHRYYQYARGVYPIHSTEDLRRAVRAIFEERKAPTHMECRLFLKALEDVSIRGTLNPEYILISAFPPEEHVRVNAEVILDALRTL